jgi:putative phage-type endonuclease
MKTLKFDDRDEWLEARKTRITGSRLKDIVVLRGNEKKIGYWELLAERLSIADGQSEDPMQRGTDLESEAIEIFEEIEGKEVNTDLVIWTREDNESIALSPDGYIGETEAVEVKCLASARHLEAYFTKKVPKDYWFQVLQYFIVNDKLEQLHFVMYDPRIPQKPYFKITIDRDTVKDDVETYLEYQKQVLDEIKSLELELSF